MSSNYRGVELLSKFSLLSFTPLEGLYVLGADLTPAKWSLLSGDQGFQ